MASTLFERFAKMSGANQDEMARLFYRMDMDIINSDRTSVSSRVESAQWLLTNPNSTLLDQIKCQRVLSNLKSECRCEEIRALQTLALREHKYLEEKSYDYHLQRINSLLCPHCFDLTGKFDADKARDHANGEDKISEAQIDEEMKRREKL